jgi:hypothetical protein
MSPNEEICRDPLFQLNLLLWLSLPSASKKPLRPILNEVGFSVYSIDPLLTLVPEQRILIKEKNVKCQDSARPDVVLRKKNNTQTFVLAECKRSSFGTGSSTAEQARTLMMISEGAFKDVMGLDRYAKVESSTVFFVPEDQTNLMSVTVKEIEEELVNSGISHGQAYVAGIIGNEKGIFLELKGKVGNILSISELSPILIIETDGENDPRPLYFIPYDPSIEQSPEEKSLCQQILCQRLLASLLGRIGRSMTPGKMTVSVEDLLNEATFGMYTLWRNRDSMHNMRNILRGLMAEVKSGLPANIEKQFYFVSGQGWIVDVSKESDKEDFINILSRIKIQGTQVSRQDQASFNDLVDGTSYKN